MPVTREAVAGRPVRLSPFTIRNSPSGRTSRPKHPAANSKCPAGMPERRCVRSGIARGVGQVLRAAPVQPPCICGISKTETRDEDRRLDQKSKHRIRPVVAPAIFSLPSCDNIMILSAENIATCRNSRERSCRRNGQRKLPDTIMRVSPFGRKTSCIQKQFPGEHSS